MIDGSRTRDGLLWAALLLSLAVVAIVRLRLLDLPLERDEGEYAYAGQLLRQGIPPYRLAYNMKFPGTYAAYAVIMTVLGETTIGIHLGLLAVNAAAIVLLFVLTRRLFGSTAAAVAAGSYAMLSVSQSVLGVCAHATHFVVLFALSGMVLLLRGMDSRDARTMLLAGLFLGLAAMMKQHGAFFPLFGILFLVRDRLRGMVWEARVVRECSALVCGIVLPLAAAWTALWATGVSGNFRRWTFGYAHDYLGLTSLGDGVLNFLDSGEAIAGRTLPVLGMAALGIVSFWWDKEHRRQAELALGFALFSFLSICPGLYFRGHYFVSFLPAVALLSGAGAAWLGRLLSSVGWKRTGVAAPAVLLLVALGYQTYREWPYFFRLTPTDICRQLFGPSPFPEAVEIARHLAENSSPTDRIAILGSEPEIYFYSGRHSATGHIYMYNLMEDRPYAAALQDEMIREIETSRPKFLLFVGVADSLGASSDSVRNIFEWFDTYVNEHYVPEGLVEILGYQTTYRWGVESQSVTPEAPYYVLIFRIKE